MPSVPTPSKAGIIQDESGDRHIPSSTRADGSKRKEIKIRPGYKPPEDVEVYKNRTAEGFRTRGKGGVPGADGLKDNEADSTPASNKNAKRREARRKATEAAASQSSEGSKLATGALAKDNWRQADDKQDKVEEVVDPEVEREKKARNLKKKLKQAKELKEKKEGGAALLPEQFAKVIKISELIRELDALGFDSEGEPKEKSEGKQEIKPDA
jgi:partner of Y14 and mago protein